MVVLIFTRQLLYFIASFGRKSIFCGGRFLCSGRFFVVFVPCHFLRAVRGPVWVIVARAVRASILDRHDDSSYQRHFRGMVIRKLVM